MRPWRLTRRQRVEMEAALFLIRPVTRRYCDASDVLHGASLLTPPDRWEWGVEGMRSWRILRARVAIALRAALRADEDARCEEAYCVAYERSLSLRSYTLAEAAHAGAWQAIRALRSWPTETRDGETVPLALWEAR